MTSPPPSSASTLRISRTFPVPREQLFQAWTDPQHLIHWWAVADGYRTPIAEVDLRVGGRYRLGMQPPDSDEVLIVGGTYREVQPPAKLVYTWRWETPDPDEPETLVTVEFRAHGHMTEVVLTHEQFADASQRDQHAQGWDGCFAQLARHLPGKGVESI